MRPFMYYLDVACIDPAAAVCCQTAGNSHSTLRQIRLWHDVSESPRREGPLCVSPFCPFCKKVDEKTKKKQNKTKKKKRINAYFARWTAFLSSTNSTVSKTITVFNFSGTYQTYDIRKKNVTNLNDKIVFVPNPLLLKMKHPGTYVADRDCSRRGMIRVLFTSL